MVFSVSPSVTVREIDATASIPAIATPPAAIAGVFRWGPVNEKILVTSETELVSRFGKPTNFNPETFFVAADYLSYSNALYVTRVVSTDVVIGDNIGAKIAGTTSGLADDVAAKEAEIADKQTEILSKQTEINAITPAANPEQEAALEVLNADLAALNNQRAILNTELDNLLATRNFFKGKYPGELGNSLRVGYVVGSALYEQKLFNPESTAALLRNVIPNTTNPVVPNIITINTNEFKLIVPGASAETGDPSIPADPETGEGGFANLVAAVQPGTIATTLLQNDILKVGNPTIGYQNLIVDSVSTPVVITETIVTTTPGIDPDTNAPITITNSTTTKLTEYTIKFKNRYSLSETKYSALTYTKLWGYASLFSGRLNDQPTGAPLPGLMHVVVEDRTGVISGTPGTILEVYENVSRDPNATLSDGSNNYYKTVIENRSSWIVPNEESSLDTETSISGYDNLSGGSDGLSESGIALGSLAVGYDLYKDSQEIDISFVLQGKAIGANLANYIISNIADRRKDCVAFISPQRSDVVDVANPQEKLTKVINFRNLIQSSSYFFMDSGYKYRYDKYNDVYRWIPLNGDMAGLCSRIDPWESPAGYKRGIIKNVVKLAFNPNKEQRDQLYGSDVNPVISQVGQGVLLFGDKTGLGTATGSAFTRINVRRLFIVVEKAIATVSASFLFDFNDEFTQTQFKNLVEPFLRDIQGRRGIIDFRVISDSTVNTPDVIDRNMFRGNIFIKPARTINFIELTFIATRTGVEFDEIIGQSL